MKLAILAVLMVACVPPKACPTCPTCTPPPPASPCSAATMPPLVKSWLAKVPVPPPDSDETGLLVAWAQGNCLP